MYRAQTVWSLMLSTVLVKVGDYGVETCSQTLLHLLEQQGSSISRLSEAATLSYLCLRMCQPQARLSIKFEDHSLQFLG
jgi:hypothetical protein